MPSRQVPRSEWDRFFREFNRRHGGCPVTVRVLHPRIGSQVEARVLPLEGVVPPSSDDDPFALFLGRPSVGNVGHAIESPRQVWLETLDSGAEGALGILSDDGTTTILEIGPATRPLAADASESRRRSSGARS